MTKTQGLRLCTVAIGDELLDGRIADTNCQRLALALFEVGVRVERAEVISDDIDEIVDRLRALAVSHDVIVTSGGLGPTTDDLTAEAVAKAAGCRVVMNEEALQSIERRFAERGIPMPANNRRQAEVPEVADIFQNGAGISPAFRTLVGEGEQAAQVWSLPGVPSEYDWFVREHIVPSLAGEGASLVTRRTLRCLGITESGLGHALEAFEAAHPEARVQYRTKFPENHVRLVVEAMDGEDSTALNTRVDGLVTEAREAIGGSVFHVGEEELEELLVTALAERGMTLALAESCTGGLVAKRLTDVAGSSRAFVGGVVAYANEVKTGVLGVSPETLETHGAVSEEVAAELASGARDRLGADFALSVTGVAGPGGGTEDKPVGTVCFGLATPSTVKTKRRFLPLPGRDRVRGLSAAVALRWLLSTLQKDVPGPDQGTDLVR